MEVSNGCGVLVINLSDTVISSIFNRRGNIGKAVGGYSVVVFRVSTNWGE